MHRQPSLDTGPVRCLYALHPDQRPRCQLTAVIRYGPIALCADCDTRRSTMGKGQAPHRLPAQQALNVLTWITRADAQLHQAQADLAATVTRARTHGHTWTQIAARLGITRQAAQQRFPQDHFRKA